MTVKILHWFFAIGILFLLSCLSDKSTNPTSIYSLKGEWQATGKNDYERDDSNWQVNMVFMENFEFEKRFLSTNINDTMLSRDYGTYEIINNHLLNIQIHESWVRWDDSESRTDPTPIDTTIYWLMGNKLEYSYRSSSYKQLYGKPNQLLDGAFYRTLSNNNKTYYTHFKYEFYQDSVRFSYHENNSPELPSVWSINHRFRCNRQERELSIFNYGDELMEEKCYLFIGGVLYMSDCSLLTVYRID